MELNIQAQDFTMDDFKDKSVSLSDSKNKNDFRKIGTVILF
jgi:hypothetical protein